MSEDSEHAAVVGMGYATMAYVVWGFVPVYWKQVAAIPAMEVLAPRIVCTALLMVGLLVSTRRGHEFADFDRTALVRAFGAATLLSINWLTFIYAVQTERVVATSLGYYINPLVSVVLGLVVLRERIDAVQSAAVTLAALGVAYLTYASGGLPWIAIVLAVSFGLYGLVHKLAPGPPLAGLAVEMLMMTPVAVVGWLWLASRGEAALVDADWSLRWLVAASALVTAVPLVCFHAATRRLPLYAVGMFQYIAPTLSLVLAVALYDEPFSRAHALGFGGVWAGLLLFTTNSLVRARRAREPATSAGVTQRAHGKA